MSVTYSAAAKTARMQAIADLIDAGSGPGVIEIGTAGMASVLATIPLADPCGSASAGVLTFDFDPAVTDTSADSSGTAAEARIKDSDGTTVISGLTVGLTSSGADIELDSVAITAGQAVELTAGTITHA